MDRVAQNGREKRLGSSLMASPPRRTWACGLARLIVW